MAIRDFFGRDAARAGGAICLTLATVGCMTYRGPRGAEAMLEQRLGVTMHRTFGLELGPISTKIVQGLADDDGELRGLSRIGVAIFEVDGRSGNSPRAITAMDLGLPGWDPFLSTRSGSEQVLLLGKSRRGRIHEMMVLAVDDDEVVLARLTGRLDRILARAVDAGKQDGARGARLAIGVGDN